MYIKIKNIHFLFVIIIPFILNSVDFLSSLSVYDCQEGGGEVMWKYEQDNETVKKWKNDYKKTVNTKLYHPVSPS